MASLLLFVLATHPGVWGWAIEAVSVTLQPHHEVCQQPTISSIGKAGQYGWIVVLHGTRVLCSPRSHKPQGTSSYVVKPPLRPRNVYAVCKLLLLFPGTALSLTHCACWEMTSLPRDTRAKAPIMSDLGSPSPVFSVHPWYGAE